MTPNLLSGILGAAKGFFTGGPIGAIAGGIGGLTQGGQNTGGSNGTGGAQQNLDNFRAQGASNLGNQEAMQQEILRQTQESQLSGARFQAQMAALKTVSEAFTAGTDARKDVAGKIGQSGK